MSTNSPYWPWDVSEKETMIATNPSPPSPGIYRNIPFEEYLAWPALSNSRINLARRSLLHFKEQVSKENPTLSFGRFIHAGILEPLTIPMRYAVMPPFEFDEGNTTDKGAPSTSKATKYYKAKAAEFAKVNAGKEIVEQADYDNLLGIARSLAASPRARSYLTEPGEAEVSLLWEDDDTGLLCKARVDFLNSAINDLKTCADAMMFSKSIANYGYHRQGAHYQNGCSKLIGEILPFRLIAIEKTQPWGNRAAELDNKAIEAGRSELRETLLAIKRAKETGRFPSYEDPETWSLPSFYTFENDFVGSEFGSSSFWES